MLTAARNFLDSLESDQQRRVLFSLGGRDRAGGEGHYYRIHGPTVLIEYDNTQNNANHIHTVMRDLENDFGLDLLRRHYTECSH